MENLTPWLPSLTIQQATDVNALEQIRVQ